jgi:hypothetical protein
MLGERGGGSNGANLKLCWGLGAPFVHQFHESLLNLIGAHLLIDGVVVQDQSLM